jgi:hypothetical protein
MLGFLGVRGVGFEFTCKVSTLLIETNLHFALVILEMGGGLMNYMFRLASNLNSPDVSLPSS